MKENFTSSLLNFFQTAVLPLLSGHDFKILDLGSADYSLFEKTDLNKKLIEAIDLKIDTNQLRSSEIKYFIRNITESNSFKNNYYDLIFDSHCLHCLKSNEEQEIALKNIYSSLEMGGIFASEIMVQPSVNKVYFPSRVVREAIDLEKMIVNTGFKIIYFVIVPQMNFYFEANEGEIVCDMLRVIAKK